METLVLSLGGEDYSTHYEIINGSIEVDSVNNMHGVTLEMSEEFFNEVIEEIKEAENK